MAVNISYGFKPRYPEVIDDRLVMTSAEMVSVNKNTFPKEYFCLCKDDGKMYSYNVDNEPMEPMGKWRQTGGSSVSGKYDEEEKCLEIF